MKRELSFLLSLENYTWKIVGRVSTILPYLGITIIGITILSSIIDHKTSVAGARGLREASIKAARVGDYVMAQYLFNLHKAQAFNSQNVLGMEREIEDLVFPEQTVAREIESYEALLESYPGHRDIYLALARLYGQINRTEQAQKYYDLARELDPNNEALFE